MAVDASAAAPEHTATIGPEGDSWQFSAQHGFDLTRGIAASPSSPHITLATSTGPVTLSTASAALIVVDMQNLFLSPALGRSRDSAGWRALHALTTHALPAARRAGLRVVWLNWGLTEAELAAMPAGVRRAFGFMLGDGDGAARANKHGDVGAGAKGQRGGPGSDQGEVVDPASGAHVQVGRLLMRGSWNTALCAPLDSWYEDGRQRPVRPDVWVHKNRMSGLWGARTELDAFLEAEGIRTLLFAGVNTDQCVSGTLTDAFSKGYDCVLLSEGCGTTSPDYAQRGIEFNAEGTWGFLSSCQALGKAASAIG